MAAFTAAHAETFSFTVGGRHVTISASRNCLSASCVAIAFPGIITTHRKRSDDVVTVQDAAPVKPPPKAAAVAAPAPVVVPQAAPAASPSETRATVQPPPSPPLPALKLAASDSKEAAAPPPAEPVKVIATEKPAEPPAAAASPAPVLQLDKAVDIEREDSPVGDWQTEGKIGAVRIEACGKALCGYLINPSSHAKAETILINMKPNSDTEWRGSIFSRASGNTYNATMTLKSASLLRVEACALGQFFCSGNNWTRIIKQPAALVTSRSDDGEPRS
jgi:uncharacterized protein (DUF2147 family)